MKKKRFNFSEKKHRINAILANTLPSDHAVDEKNDAFMEGKQKLQLFSFTIVLSTDFGVKRTL